MQQEIAYAIWNARAEQRPGPPGGGHALRALAHGRRRAGRGRSERARRRRDVALRQDRTRRRRAITGPTASSRRCRRAPSATTSRRRSGCSRPPAQPFPACALSLERDGRERRPREGDDEREGRRERALDLDERGWCQPGRAHRQARLDAAARVRGDAGALRRRTRSASPSPPRRRSPPRSPRPRHEARIAVATQATPAVVGAGQPSRDKVHDHRGAAELEGQRADPRLRPVRERGGREVRRHTGLPDGLRRPGPPDVPDAAGDVRGAGLVRLPGGRPG